MRVAEINMVNFGSTGRIALQIADYVRKNGGDAITFSTHVASKHYKKIRLLPKGRLFMAPISETTCIFCLDK